MMDRIGALYGAELAQEMPGGGRFAPIHVPPKGGDVVELAHPTQPIAEIGAGIGAELAHPARRAGTSIPGSCQRNEARDRALLSIARTCLEKNHPLPNLDRLAAAFGICQAQVVNVRKRLEREGRLKLRRVSFNGTHRLGVVEVGS